MCERGGRSQCELYLTFDLVLLILLYKIDFYFFSVDACMQTCKQLHQVLYVNHNARTSVHQYKFVYRPHFSQYCHEKVVLWFLSRRCSFYKDPTEMSSRPKYLSNLEQACAVSINGLFAKVLKLGTHIEHNINNKHLNL